MYIAHQSNSVSQIRTNSEPLLATLVHIQTHLDGDLSLSTLAAQAGFSPYHFHRLFTAFVGESFKQHVRRLRLERGAYRLRISRAPIVDIAFEAGFGSHATFTRAFQRQFGISPSAFRKDFVQHHADEERDFHSQSDGQLHPYLGTTDSTKVRVGYLKPITVAFIRYIGPYESVGGEGASLASIWEELYAWGIARGLVDSKSLLLGIGHDDPDVVPPEKLRFDVCIQIPAPVEPSGQIGIQTIAPGPYAVARHYGSFENIGDTYAKIGLQWLPKRRFTVGPNLAFEIYNHTQVLEDIRIDYTDVYISLAEKNPDEATAGEPPRIQKERDIKFKENQNAL